MLKKLVLMCIATAATGCGGAAAMIRPLQRRSSNPERRVTELCRLPFNEIKIDRTLIHSVPGQREASTITGAIIELAHRLSMRVCAEGVETQEAFRFLAAAGCDSVQGVLFAAPVSAGEVEALAQQRQAA